MDWETNDEYAPPGQCTDYLASTRAWLPSGLGNACDWLLHAMQRGMRTSATPYPGAVVVYGRGEGYSPAFGHVAAVLQVYGGGGTFNVIEGNWRNAGKVTTRISSMAGVLGFILAPKSASTAPPAEIPPVRVVTGAKVGMTEGEKRALVRLAWVGGLGREPSDEAGITDWASRITDDGSTAEQVITGLLDSPEAQQWRARLRVAAGIG